MTAFALLFIGTGFLLIALSIPLIRRKVKPNALYGLRVPATMSDEWVWYEANEQSGRDLCILGALQILVSVGLWIIPGVSPAAYVIVNSVVITAGALIAGFLGWLRANRLLAARKAE